MSAISKPLAPHDCTPPITPELAGRLFACVNLAREKGVVKFPYPPTIVVHVWTESLDKEVCDAEQAETTIARLTAAIAALENNHAR